MAITVLERSLNPRQAVKDLILENIRAIQHTFAADKVALCEVLDLARDKSGVLRANGGFEFRQKFCRAFNGLPVNGDLANHVFASLEQEAINQFGSLENARTFLDQLVAVKNPPTEQEIAAAWEIESGSSEEGKRYFYGSEHPKALLEKLAKGDG